MTIKEVLDQAATRYGAQVAVRYKAQGSWRTICFCELRDRARMVCELCVRNGIQPGDRVGLYRENSPEWFEVYLGIVACGAVVVPVDAALREQEVLHVLWDSGAVLLFASERFYPLIDAIAGDLPCLKRGILIDCGGDVPPASGPVCFASYEEQCFPVREISRKPGAAYDRFGPAPDDPASIIYTSGTTGRQKGAVLLHRNFIANVQSCLSVLEIRPDDHFLIVLPLHHSFAFTALFLLPLYCGCEVSLVENLRSIAQNMAETRPTILMGVPLLLEKMQGRILQSIREKPAARLLFRVGLGRIAGKAVVRKLGGRLRLIVTGAAPCDPEGLHNWKRLGIPVIEGYGITETAPVLCVNPLDAPRPGTVGRAIPGVEVRIDEPNAEGVGEICVRGANVMRGYWNQPEATAEVLRDGWYHTGDLGWLDADGYLTISGRKKNLIVNREGKNIYPEEVEQQLLKSPLLLECLVLGYRDPGDPAGERIGVIAVPNLETIAALPEEDAPRSDAQIAARIRQEIKIQSDGLAPYKRPRFVQIRFEEFEKTSTAKIKRHLYAMDTSRGEMQVSESAGLPDR